MSEEIVFDGSTTHKHQILKWLDNDEKFKDKKIHTRDITILTLPNGTNASRGDVIIKHSKNNYEIKRNR